MKAELQAVTAATDEPYSLNKPMIFVRLVKKRLPHSFKVDDMFAIKKVINGNFSPQSNDYAVLLNVALDR